MLRTGRGGRSGGASPYLGYHLSGFLKVRAPAHRVGLGKVVLDQAKPNVVSHLVQLLVDLNVVTVVVFAQLGNDSAVCEYDELRVDLVDARPS